MKAQINKPTGKKYRHNLSNNVYTTSSFGFCQPVYVRECASQDTLKLRTANMVYLNPVVKPTFGRLSLKQYKSFVPIEEIWHPFGSFMSQKPFQGALNGSYIPSQVPCLPLSVLSAFAYYCSEVYVFTVTGDAVSNGSLSFTGIEQISNPGSSELILLASTFAGPYSNSRTFIDAIQLYANDASRRYFRFGSEIFDFSDPDSNPLGRFDWFAYNNVNETHYLYAGRYTERGKNLRKIMIGCGYQLSMFGDLKTVLPLFAYYKAWFDLFAVQRESTWKDTMAYACLEYQEQTGYSLLSFGNRQENLVKFFLDELANTYYTISPDFASAHISGLGVSSASESRSILRPGSSSSSVSTPTSVVSAEDSTPYVLPTTTGLTQEILNMIRAMYERVNVKTAIGGRIREYMRAIFGAQYDQDDESNFIGASSYNIDITQVMSTAETAEGYLGEYAGKGLGQSSGDVYTFTARRQGYYIEFFCVVPDSRLAQSVDPNLDHINYQSFFDPAFDSITLLPTKKMSIFGVNDLGFKFGYSESAAGFGNIPNFMEYKVSFDKINGDMSMMSTRDSYLPFTLSKLLPYTSVYKYPGESDPYIIANVNYNPIVCGDYWRYIGRYRWLGNYDRIFENSGVNVPIAVTGGNNLEYRFDDNFVIYFYCDIDLSGYELPISGSFQTGAGSGDTMTVEKA